MKYCEAVFHATVCIWSTGTRAAARRRLRFNSCSKECTVLLLDDNTSADSDRQLESLAHGVVLLEQHFPKYGGPRRQLRVVKLRGVNFEGGCHDFNIETGGINVFPRLVSAEHRSKFD